MSNGESDNNQGPERLSVMSCHKCFGSELTLIVMEREPLELQPACMKCREALGVRLKPTTENYNYIFHNGN